MCQADIQTTGPAYNYTVKMTCGGCSGAIERVLKKNIEAREYFVEDGEAGRDAYGSNSPSSSISHQVTPRLPKEARRSGSRSLCLITPRPLYLATPRPLHFVTPRPLAPFPPLAR